MTDIDKYLEECVYYPCSSLYAVPIRFLGDKFKRFFYVDYNVTREEFDSSIRQGVEGYQLCSTEELTPEAVFGLSWSDMREKYFSTIEQLEFKWNAPFVVLFRFQRTDDFDDSHGPEYFELMFARCEAIAAFIEAFSRRDIAPRCLVYIRTEGGFGGNYSEYPQRLDRAVHENKGGMPPLMFFDRMGSDKDGGDYSSLVEDYEEIVKIIGFPDGGRLTLARLNRDHPVG